MRFLSNAHTHTAWCDGTSTTADMIAAAKRLGFVSLGFSGHADQGFDFEYSMGQGRQESYRKELRVLKAQMSEAGESPRLWVGLEQDAFVPSAQKKENRERFDYIIGSTHYLSTDFHGQAVAVDGDYGVLKAYVEEAYAGDMLQMVQAYYDLHVRMLLADRPDVIGHFDVVRKYIPNGRLAGSPAYEKIALAALTKAFASGAVMEVNTGGMARGYTGEPFPSRELLLAWREMGGAVTLTSDCHNAAHMDYGFADMLVQLKAWGFQSVLRLGTGDCLWEAVEC